MVSYRSGELGELIKLVLINCEAELRLGGGGKRFSFTPNSSVLLRASSTSSLTDTASPMLAFKIHHGFSSSLLRKSRLYVSQLKFGSSPLWVATVLSAPIASCCLLALHMCKKSVRMRIEVRGQLSGVD